jgi:hypothetical protein
MAMNFIEDGREYEALGEGAPYTDYGGILRATVRLRGACMVCGCPVEFTVATGWTTLRHRKRCDAHRRTRLQ